MRILLVENDPALGTFLKQGFEADNYDVELTSSGDQALCVAAGVEFAAALLDIGVRDFAILDVIRQLRGIHPHLPILVLTLRTRPEDRAQMLDLGADDIVLKPFALSELRARVRALLRRGTRLPETALRVEDLELNLVQHKARRAGRMLELTPKEFALLEYLMRNAGKHVTRAEIIQHVWNLSFDTTCSSILTAPPSAAPFIISTTVSCPAAISSSVTRNLSMASVTNSAWCTFPAPPPTTAPISRKRYPHDCLSR